jgi:hypothetical protein
VVHDAAPQKAVIPAKAGIQYAAASRFYLTSLEYWITRWSLSSGAHSRDPVAGDDEVGAAGTSHTPSHSRGAFRPSFAINFPPSIRGRRECRALVRPQPRVYW